MPIFDPVGPRSRFLPLRESICRVCVSLEGSERGKRTTRARELVYRGRAASRAELAHERNSARMWETVRLDPIVTAIVRGKYKQEIENAKTHVATAGAACRRDPPRRCGKQLSAFSCHAP